MSYEPVISERCRVEQVAGDCVTVSAYRQLDCPRCAAGKGCGNALFGGLIGSRLLRIEARSDGTVGPIAVGDEVEVALEAAATVKGAAFVYLLPLALMMASILLAAVAGLGEAMQAVAGAAGLCAGFLAVAALGPSGVRGHAWQPRVIARCEPGNASRDNHAAGIGHAGNCNKP